MRILPRIPGEVRDHATAALRASIKQAVAKTAAQFNCSKSFVIQTILAEQLNVELGKEEKFYVVKTTGRRKSSYGKAGRTRRRA